MHLVRTQVSTPGGQAKPPCVSTERAHVVSYHAPREAPIYLTAPESPPAALLSPRPWTAAPCSACGTPLRAAAALSGAASRPHRLERLELVRTHLRNTGGTPWCAIRQKPALLRQQQLTRVHGKHDRAPELFSSSCCRSAARRSAILAAACCRARAALVSSSSASSAATRCAWACTGSRDQRYWPRLPGRPKLPFGVSTRCGKPGLHGHEKQATVPGSGTLEQVHHAVALSYPCAKELKCTMSMHRPVAHLELTCILCDRRDLPERVLVKVHSIVDRFSNHVERHACVLQVAKRRVPAPQCLSGRALARRRGG